MKLPFEISCKPPHLIAIFAHPQAVLSWSISRPGFQIARQVVWREVRNADLPSSEDPMSSLARLMSTSHLDEAVVLVTSRTIARYHLEQTAIEGETATCLATVGLSNGERVGQRCAEPVLLPGTVNILLHVDRPLSQAAFLETMSVVTQARTTAILDSKVRRAGVAITGTGTDCIVVAAPQGTPEARFAGLHTALGEAVGDVVYRTMRAGIPVWEADYAASLEARR